jgi:8-oxo-dGTP diphosphatase
VVISPLCHPFDAKVMGRAGWICAPLTGIVGKASVLTRERGAARWREPCGTMERLRVSEQEPDCSQFGEATRMTSEQDELLNAGGASARDPDRDPEHDSARFRVGVFAVIEVSDTERETRYLLARRADIGWWNLVGGGLEYDETPEEGLAREAREEIGAEIAVIRLVGVYAKPQKCEIVLTYLCRLAPDSPAPTTSEEVSEVGVFTLAELPDDLLPKHRQRVLDAASGQREAFRRTQATSSAEDQRR